MNIKELLTQDVSWYTIKVKLVELDQKYSITQRGEQFSKNHFVALRIFLVFLFAFIVFWQSWTTDDAYHSYVMARHLADGKGLVYNGWCCEWCLKYQSRYLPKFHTNTEIRD